MHRWVYWAALIFIVGVVAFPAYRMLTDPQAEIQDLFRLGIDLQGGTSLIYELHAADVGGIPPDATAAREVILQRIDPQGTRAYMVRPVGRRLEIVLPGRSKVTVKAETPTKALLTVALKAAIDQRNAATADLLKDNSEAFLAGTRFLVRMSPAMYLDDIQARIVQAARERVPDQVVSIAVVGTSRSGDQWDECAVMLTAAAADAKRAGEWKELVRSCLSAQKDVTRVKRLVKQAGFLEFRITADKIKDRDKANFDRLIKLKQEGKPTDDPRFRWYPYKEGWELYASPRGNALEAWNAVYVVDPQMRTVEILVNVDDKQDVTGRDMAKAYASMAEGENVVSFQMRPQAAQRFARLTSPDMRYRQMAIILDGVVQSAPQLEATLSTGGIIRGYKVKRELEEVVTVLNSGQLAASLGDPVTERTVGPELGEDNIHKGLVASVTGMILVLAFMACYYLFAGMVADVALLLNLVMTVCIMFVIRQTWTLPGIAGLILSMAMAVDANVLINERLREERGREGSLSFALKKAYERAFRTILDSNLTTVIPAFVLLWPGLATEEVKGFAVVMIIGIGVSMFTAVVVTRILFEKSLAAGIVKKFRMLQLVSVPSLDWMRAARVLLVVSGLVGVAGLVAFYLRGDDKYDIEFTGGTQVELALKIPAGEKEVPIRRVRELATQALGPAVTVQELEYTNDPREGVVDRFLISASATGTTVTGEADVKAALLEVFKDMRPEATGGRADVTAAEITDDRLRGPPTAGPPAAPKAPDAAAPPPAGEVATARFIQPELRQYLGKIVLTVQVAPSMTVDDVQRRLDPQIRDRFPDLVSTPRRVTGKTPGASAGEFSSFEIWVREDFAGRRLETPNPAFWADLVKSALGGEEAFASVTSFEPSMAGETRHKAVVAILFSIIGIVVYIWFRFAKATYGIAAVISLVYDVLVTLGAVAISAYVAETWLGRAALITDMKINLAMVGAFLTLVGYSINDKIVIFDRIRENRGKYGTVSIELLNRSINQTLSRTIWTGFTTLMVLAILYIFGGATSTLHGFSFVLFFGIVMGTYSSLMVAVPGLVLRSLYGKPGQKK
jgi:SecD/SecF fusion protein